jgi:hypothetical protein
MKRNFYIACAAALGVLIAIILYALLEMWHDNMLSSNFGAYSFGYSWEVWQVIHFIIAVLFVLTGLRAGISLGTRWWEIVYVEHRHWLMRRRIK